MNWGYKILTVYLIFIAGILLLVFKSSSQKMDLVASDYYEQELKYQARINETERANSLSAALKYAIIDRDLVIDFPAEMNTKRLTAQVLLYCTADQTKDVQKNFSTENGQVEFPLPSTNKGLHELRVTWAVNGTSYFFKHKIMLP